MARVREMTDKNFHEEVLGTRDRVLVDFWAPWCHPCLVMALILERMAVHHAGQARFAKLNIDDNPVTASRFGIKSIPTLILFREGVEEGRLVGAAPAEMISAMLDETVVVA